MKTDQGEQPVARQAEPLKLHAVRQCMAARHVASAKHGEGDSAGELSTALFHSPGPVRTGLPTANLPSGPLPIWLAALVATSCEAQRNGENHAVLWNWVSGRALYTNTCRDAEHIEPLGVSLKGGHTMAVYWTPGETAYTVEVYRQAEWCPWF